MKYLFRLRSSTVGSDGLCDVPVFHSDWDRLLGIL
jgi:hypothetical protein